RLGCGLVFWSTALRSARSIARSVARCSCGVRGGSGWSLRLPTFDHAKVAVGPPAGDGQSSKQDKQKQCPPHSRLWWLRLKKRIQAREGFPQRVHAGLNRAGLIRIRLNRGGLTRAGLIQAEHGETADGWHWSSRGAGDVLDGSDDRFFDTDSSRGILRVRDPWWWWRCWRRRRYGRARRPPRFKGCAAHSAKAEIVRIVLTALRADHDGSPNISHTV